MRVWSLTPIAVLAACGTWAQPAASSFEVASVRVLPGGALPQGFSLSPNRTGGRIRWTTNLPLLLRYAYHLPNWRIAGADKDQSFYSVDATMDASATEDQVRTMLQGLLTERFKLAVHRETKDVQAYALEVEKNGPKIKAAAEGEPHPMPEYFSGKPPEPLEGRILVTMEGIGTSALTGRGVTMAQLADTLSDNLGTFVIDKTGLKGKYYFGFKFLQTNNAANNADAASIFAALPDELGLRLEKQRGPAEFLVVDHVERPSEN